MFVVIVDIGCHGYGVVWSISDEDRAIYSGVTVFFFWFNFGSRREYGRRLVAVFCDIECAGRHPGTAPDARSLRGPRREDLRRHPPGSMPRSHHEPGGELQPETRPETCRCGRAFPPRRAPPAGTTTFEGIHFGPGFFFSHPNYTKLPIELYVIQSASRCLERNVHHPTCFRDPLNVNTANGTSRIISDATTLLA